MRPASTVTTMLLRQAICAALLVAAVTAARAMRPFAESASAGRNCTTPRAHHRAKRQTGDARATRNRET